VEVREVDPRDDAAVAERMPSGWRSMPVLVLTSDGGSALAGRLESRLGRPVPNVWADRPPGWYEADAAG